MIPFSVIDAFTDVPFAGNPAAVCLLERWPSDEWLQLVGREMNLSETAFLVPRGCEEYELRWFTPKVEVTLRSRDARRGALPVVERNGLPVERPIGWDHLPHAQERATHRPRADSLGRN